MIRKALVGNLLILSISVSLALLAGEFATRSLFPKPRRVAVPDPILHHVHRPNSNYLEEQELDKFEPVMVRFNSLGLREEREIDREKHDNEFRILLLGDSFVEARQVSYDATVSQQLEGRLNNWARRRGCGRTYVAINAGVSGYSPSLEYLYLIHRGVSLKPDLVILFFAFNDVTDDFHYRGTMTRDDRGLPLRVMPAGNWPMLSYNWIRWVVLQSRLLELARVSFGRLGSGGGTYAFAKERSLTRNALAIFKKEYDDSEVEAWEETKEYLAGIQGTLERVGIPFVLVVIPSPPQVNAVQWRIGKVKWGMKADDVIESTKMQDVLADHSRRHKTYFVDLLPAFKANSRVKLFYDYDGHWTPEGNGLAAEETFKFLVVKGLVGGAGRDRRCTA